MSTTDKTKKERAPLLPREVSHGAYGSSAAPEEGESAVQEANECENLVKDPTPLPLNQLLVVFAMRLAEPIAYTQIFPVCQKYSLIYCISCSKTDENISYYPQYINEVSLSCFA